MVRLSPRTPGGEERVHTHTHSSSRRQGKRSWQIVLSKNLHLDRLKCSKTSGSSSLCSVTRDKTEVCVWAKHASQAQNSHHSHMCSYSGEVRSQSVIIHPSILFLLSGARSRWQQGPRLPFSQQHSPKNLIRRPQNQYIILHKHTALLTCRKQTVSPYRTQRSLIIWGLFTPNDQTSKVQTLNV